MNAIDGIFNYVSGFLERMASWIDPVSIPWNKLSEKWAVIQPHITKWNTIFPLDSMLVIAGLMIAFVTVILVLWAIKFIKSMIPFLG